MKMSTNILNKLGLTTVVIAEYFGYETTKSFTKSRNRYRVEFGVFSVVKMLFDKREELIPALDANDLQSLHKSILNEYVNRFQAKHDIQFDYWVGDKVGGLAVFIGEYFFSSSDIIYDIDNKCVKELIMEWHDDLIVAHCNGSDVEISFPHYKNGLRFKQK
jgi:hypothetical protein